MIIHIGENISLFKKDIIAILDKDSALESKDSRNFINNLINNNSLVNNLEKDIKSYIITNSNKRNVNNPQRYNLYTSNISSTSLLKRINKGSLDWRNVNG